MTWCRRRPVGVNRRSMSHRPMQPGRAVPADPMFPWRGRWLALPLTVLLALAVTSCGGGKDKGPTADDTTTTTTATTSTTVKPEVLPKGHFIALKLPAGLTAQEKTVAEAYRAAAESFSRALRVPSKRSDLTPYFSGLLLDATTKRLVELRKAGQATRLPSGGTMAIRVVAANITHEGAGMLVCILDDSETYETATGDSVSSGTTKPHEVAVVLVQNAGSWTASESRVPHSGEWRRPTVRTVSRTLRIVRGDHVSLCRTGEPPIPSADRLRDPAST